MPDPALSTIPNVVVVPGGGLQYQCTIVGSSGPIDSANVTLVWSTAGDTTVCWCSGQVHPSVSASTNASGIATFDIHAGGCLDPATIPGGIAVEVFVNSVKLKEVGQVSPDVLFDSATPCNVTAGDAVSFTPPLAGGAYTFCYDLNSDLIVGAADAVIVTPWLASAASCN